MKNKPLGCLAPLLLLAAAPAYSNDVGPLDQIIVSGSRAPLSISRVGAAVTVISRNDIERREARNIAELLRSVPGFAVSHTGVSGSQTQVRVRGAEANHVLVLIDGMRANDPATGDEFRWEYLSTASIERIEIVRGPQSSLWGSDAIAGVINIITRGTDTQRSFHGFAEGGSFATLNAGVGASFGSGDWHFTGNVEHLSTDGENIARSGSEADDSDLTTANLAAQYASGRTTVDASLRVVDAYSQFDPVDFFTTGLPTDGDVATETENIYGAMSLTVAGDRVTHSLRANYFDSGNDNLAAGTKASSAASDRTLLGYQADIALQADVLSVAVEHEATTFRQRGDTAFGDPNQDQDIETASVIAEYQGLSHDRFSWIASARFDANSDFENAVNGRLSASYRVGEATVLRASAGTGRKNPTFIERFGFFPGQFVGNPDLEPERSTSYEVGVDREFGGGAGQLQLSVFRQDLEDEIDGFVFDPVTFLATARNMNSKSRRNGGEIALRWASTDHFGFGAHYTYTDSRDASAAELRRPRHAGGVAADFIAFDERLQVNLTADYGGERFDVFFPPFPEPSRVVSLADYWLVDLTVHYRLGDNVRVFARGTNLLDEDYEQVYGYRTPGRAAYAGIRVDFGN